MNPGNETAETVSDLFEKAVETLATGTEHIQQRLADAYVRSRLGDDANVNRDLPADVCGLQLDLQAAMSTSHDSERGAAAASAGSLTDDQCTILARRIVAAARTMREFCLAEQLAGIRRTESDTDPGTSAG
jgi:hypothetical protein